MTRNVPTDPNVDASDVVKRFIEELQRTEISRRATARLIALFAKKCRLQNVTRQNLLTHAEPHLASAESFWSQYLHAFAHVRSRFTNVIDDGDSAVLEWISEGELPNGMPVTYQGVSVLEYTDDEITEFRTYYDSAALLPHAPRSTKTYSETVGLPPVTNQVTS